MGHILGSVFKLFLVMVISIIILLAIAIVRTVVLPSENLPKPCDSSDKDFISNSRRLTDRFSNALQFQTISYTHHMYNTIELLKFQDYIFKSFPSVHSSPLVTYEVVNKFSLLYHIRGSNNSLKPYLLAGHLDVVPIEEANWDDPPFAGVIRDGYVIGRGSIDCKHVVMGSLEALEFLLEKGHQPERSFYLAFGHDEEVSGLDGASHISLLLKSRNVTLEFILDEGSFVFDDFIPKISSPIAFVGVTEKGSLDLKLEVHTIPGHSSFPSKETAIIILAKALSKLEGNVFPSMFGRGPEELLFRDLAYCAPFPLKVVFNNLWLFKPFVVMYMSDAMMSAIHRTTTAVTMVNGGTKVNVMPSSASAAVNIRVHPAQTIAEAVSFVTNLINDDRVKMRILHQVPPHPMSPLDSFGYATIKKSIKQIYSDCCVTPVTLIANTDTRWYLDLTKSIYRFSLVRMTPKESSRFHGDNEKIAVQNYIDIVNFFLHLIKNSDSKYVTEKHTHEDL